MKIPCSKLLWFTCLSLLLLPLTSSGLATELSLRPFTASYDLYRGGMHIAKTELKLERDSDHWRWSSLTRARSIYSLFTRKQPYTETRFAPRDGLIWLHEIVIGDAAEKKFNESARFDWVAGKLDVLRKGKRRQLQLDGAVYDYQSIHLLAATMGRKQLDKSTINFYYKGRLIKSRFVYTGQQQVKIEGKNLRANAYEQTIPRSDTMLKYYYDAANPLLPLRIEKLETGESPAVLTLNKVDWEL